MFKRHNRMYGRCKCGMWTSILKDSIFELNKDSNRHLCWVCQEPVKVWYTIDDYRVWWKPWTWGDKFLVCNGVNNGWSSQSLPRELWKTINIL